MNLHRMLQARAAAGKPLRVALIGAGKFGSMYLAQAKHTPGIHVVAHRRPRARARARGAGARRLGGGALRRALARRRGASGARRYVTDDALALIAAPEVEIVIDATGNPAAGIRHALACCAHGKHVVMVNVEADALAGPLLAQRAREAGIVYSLAYGDQPALICEMVDWCRAAGFEVVAAGKGTKYLPDVSRVDARDRVAALRLHARRWSPPATSTRRCSTRSSTAPRARSRWRRWPTRPACCPRPTGSRSRRAASTTCRACCGRATRAASSHHAGQVEVISSLERDGRPVFRDLRWGVYVTFRAGDATGEDYVRRCFREYGFSTDPSGRYSAMYKPYHAIGLELGISVASVGPAARADRRADRRGTATWSPPRSATSPPARRSTAKAATRSTASSCRPPIRCGSAACRWGSRTA